MICNSMPLIDRLHLILYFHSELRGIPSEVYKIASLLIDWILSLGQESTTLNCQNIMESCNVESIDDVNSALEFLNSTPYFDVDILQDSCKDNIKVKIIIPIEKLEWWRGQVTRIGYDGFYRFS